jgi:NhaP-type Na+/H+ or K+/H+ antiporter
MEILVGKLALIGALGFAAQWLAWRWQLPAIVLLLLAGFVAGPVTGVLAPVSDFGALLRPLIAVAVAVILFEGGLTLNFAQIRETSVAVRQLVTIGAGIAFCLTTAAAHYIAGLSWPAALLLGAILIVTGPTVVTPLLRHARLQSRPASLLRWEAILADPLGALLAVLVFEAVLVVNHVSTAGVLIAEIVAAMVWATLGGYGLARLVVFAFVRGLVPEFLKAPMLMSIVVATYAVSNFILEESGLLTVTVLGVVIGNSRIASLSEIRRFKEVMTVMLVSSVFIILTASLSFRDLESLDLQALAFIGCLLFVIRPVSVLISTLGSGVPFKDLALVAWIAPRGVVAVAVAGLFGAGLLAQGVADAELVMPLTFAVVVVTVVAHGFSIRALAAWLGVGGAGSQGVLIVGASPWSVGLARALTQLEIPVTIADRNWYRLRHARNAGLPAFWGEILSEVAEHQLAFNQFGVLIAATDNDDYNALICTNFGPEFGRGNVFEIGRAESSMSRHDLTVTLGGRPLLPDCGGFDALNARIEQGWTFGCTRLTEDFGVEAFAGQGPADRIVIAVQRGQKLIWQSAKAFDFAVDDIALSFSPPAATSNPSSVQAEESTN